MLRILMSLKGFRQSLCFRVWSYQRTRTVTQEWCGLSKCSGGSWRQMSHLPMCQDFGLMVTAGKPGCPFRFWPRRDAHSWWCLDRRNGAAGEGTVTCAHFTQRAFILDDSVVVILCYPSRYIQPWCDFLTRPMTGDLWFVFCLYITAFFDGWFKDKGIHYRHYLCIEMYSKLLTIG